MLINCPHCGFERELDPSQIPDSAVMATCPKCETRFRFRGKAPAAGIPGDVAAHSAGQVSNGDDPLPPGAIVPPMPVERKDENEETPAAQPRSGDTRTTVSRQIPDRQADRQDQDAPPRDKDAPFAEYLRQSRAGAEADAEERQHRETRRSLFSGGGPSAVPWEFATPQQLPLALYHTLLRALFAVPAFFTTVGESRAGLLRPCLFFILLRLFESVMQRFWWMAALKEHMAAIQDPQQLATLDTLVQSMNMATLLVIAPPLLILQLMLYCGLFHMMIRLLQPHKANFSTTLRVVAYASAPCIFSLVPLQYLTLPGLGVNIVSLWVSVCLFLGLKFAHKLSWSQIALVTLPLYMLGLLIGWHISKMLTVGMMG